MPPRTHDRTPHVGPPLHIRVLGSLARLLPATWRQALSTSRVGRIVHGMLQRAPGRRWYTVPAGINKGMRLLLDFRYGEYMYYWGLHEPEVQALLPEVVRPGHVMYDVGANIGLISVAAAQLVGPAGRVFAFEPLPDTAAVLEAVAAENGLRQITVIRRAVADRVEQGVMGEHDVLSTASGASGTVVPVTTLDAFVYDEGFLPPHVIKLDVEGAESRALSGMSRVVDESRPVLLIEIHPGQAEPVWNWLSTRDYDILGYVNGAWRVPAGPFVGRCLARPRSPVLAGSTGTVRTQ